MSESEPPRRKILSLKSGIAAPGGPPPLERIARPTRPVIPEPPPPPPPPVGDWKCKPCGAFFDPPGEGPDDEVVRCPGCNARIGIAGDFRQTPPPTRLRARPMRH